MTEIWKDIIGYEGLYEISNLGRVKSLERFRKGKGNGRWLLKEKILNHSKPLDSYEHAILCKNAKRTTILIHILVANHFVANPNNYPEVNHENGDKNCNEYWNLKWCTRKQNEEHAWATGLKSGMKGQNNPMCKLTNLQISEIRNKYQTGNYLQIHLAKEYGISSGYVSILISQQNRRLCY